MGSILFTIIITPIIQVLEFFFTLFYEITENEGLSVIGLSFIVTLCTLPLYMTAEKWEETERTIQQKMKPTVDRIKEVFKGDEQYMILTTYYRQNHYHPLMALRSSFSLLIQIPFFIAAYTFLSHLETLNGAKFLFIKNFGNPDETFRIGSFAINILPIAMTVINLASGMIYSKGHGIREKIQIFACAAVFLVLLYGSPAGLVVYWTMNNMLSLIKNVFYKLKNPKKTLYIIVCGISILFITASLFILNSLKIEYRLALVAAAIILPCIPLAVKIWRRILDFIFGNNEPNPLIFAFAAILLCLLAGLGIPSILMESEPEQYAYVERISSPFVFLRHTFYQALGLFIFWPVCFYNLFGKNSKKGFAMVFSACALWGLINTFLFSESYGPILPELIFMTPQKFEVSAAKIALNFFVLASALFILIVSLKKNAKIWTNFSLIICLSLAVITVKNSASINSEFKKMTPPQGKNSIEKSYHLSKEGKNVILIMQDRLINSLSKQIFEEHPEYNDIFDGFVYYPNIVSMGKFTMLGTPGIFGGYDYTPWEIMQRKDKTLQQKHNEALLTLPRIFHNEGYGVTVSGLPYENYLEYPITDMYKDDTYINRAETRGLYSDYWYKENDFPKAEFLEHDIKRNFIWFSIFKMVSPVLRRSIYHEGYWTSYDRYNDGIARFIDNYSELDYLPEMTDNEGEGNQFIMIDNELVHEAIDLPLPDFDPVRLKNTDNEFNPSLDRHYTTMVATFDKLKDFIEEIKSLGVYDNTRIVIVSDHGFGGKYEKLENNIPGINKTNFNCALLVKDFNTRGTMVEDYGFMTNADTPWLCTEGIIPKEKQVNPFTGNPLKVDNKNDYVKLFNAQAESTRIRKESGWHIKDSEWFTVKDDIYNNENWRQLFN